MSVPIARSSMFIFLLTVTAVNAADAMPQVKSSNTTKVFADTESLLVIGGLDDNYIWRKDIEAFDLSSGREVKFPALPSPRSEHGAVILGAFLYVVGGYDGTKELATVNVYVSSPIDAWFPTTSMSTARRLVGVCASETRIYAIGGSNRADYLESGESYDPATKLWEPIAPMASKRRLHAVSYLRGFVYAVGGSNGVDVINTVEKYDTGTGRWSPVRSMETTRFGLSTAIVGGKLLAIGGKDNRLVLLQSVEIYDPNTDSWGHVADMPIRRYLAGALSTGGFVYVAGGLNESVKCLDSVVVFDSKSNVWNTSKMRLSVARQNVACA